MAPARRELLEGRGDEHIPLTSTSPGDQDDGLESAESRVYRPLLFASKGYASSELYRDAYEMRSRLAQQGHEDGSLPIERSSSGTGPLRHVADPRIRLETLSSRATYTVLWITYLSFVLALALPYLQSQGYLETVCNGFESYLVKLVFKGLYPNVKGRQIDYEFTYTASHNRLVIAFRGTTSKLNWKSNLKFHQEVLWIKSKGKIRGRTCMEKVKDGLAKIPILNMALPRVHSGFWNAYASVRSELREVIRLVLDENPGVAVYITGHSMGGALAVLAAYDLAVNMSMKVSMFSFGGPRVGNPSFVRLYDKCVPASYRVVMDGDIVPGVPDFLTEIVYDSGDYISM
ncbi:hypothetical protein P43SY_008671 [Pythium insidiosum]|uniref:Fungal lipase-type domain-containing protein n=1 Tax=Pythium insidiosum TaxID=114742 RepID=A0AAD5M4C0_PYTIN|nr:hypothetical protein P43SY_008671 [Pythium insidiosum]